MCNGIPWRAPQTAEPVVSAELFPEGTGTAQRQCGIGDPWRALPTVGFVFVFVVVLL